MKAVIVAKTRMGSGACVGALTFDGRSLRLIAADRATNDQFNMEYQVGEVWEIESSQPREIIPPHVENIIVQRKQRLGSISGIETFIEQQMPPVCGGVSELFDGLAQNTQSGSLYISEHIGLPSRSTLFWRPDRPLTLDDHNRRLRYRYPTDQGGCTLTFVGFQEPIEEIPAGTLLRVSLAHWWRPADKPGTELRCYAQLSGWFVNPSSPAKNRSTGLRKQTYEGLLPKIDPTLKQVFGYQAFRPLQREIIQNVLFKRDTLAVMPTGSGKSLCFQLPATLFPGLTVVVSPLISLMEDQVLELKEWGIPASYLNSTLTHDEYCHAVDRIKAGVTKLLYAAPETLLRPETYLLLERCPVDCLVIDEAHCISEWGHDFRPEYRQLAGLRSRLPGAVTLAVTATATQRVRQDIKYSLDISNANEFVSSFNRKNLTLSVTDKINGPTQVKDFLNAHRGQAGIIYCSTRERVDILTGQLQSLGYPVLPYHAGMSDEDRRRNQKRFRYEEGIIMVATIAFGMGINKSNVRFVLHYDLPRDLENYYQQIGRAGRDGLPADCLVLFSYGDIMTIRHFIRQEDRVLQKGSFQRLKALQDFLETRTCRRRPLLAYFGENYTEKSCEACDNCINPSPTGLEQQTEQGSETGRNGSGDLVDLTLPARQLLKCARETKELFGVSHLIDVLRGSQARKVKQHRHELLPSFGTGKLYTKEQWRHIAAQIIQQGLFVRVEPHGSLKVTPRGQLVLEGGSVQGVLPGTLARKTTKLTDGEYDRELFEQLRSLRMELANERRVPPYLIFHDRALIEMAKFYPCSQQALAGIYGVGQRKLEEYGAHFLPLIQSYCQANHIQLDTKPLKSKPVQNPDPN